ncbi:MAG TPA: DUF2891 family protein, partial [Bacillota bacterium]|nr:DUF2891 family protein [Bacillota bacterium]
MKPHFYLSGSSPVALRWSRCLLVSAWTCSALMLRAAAADATTIHLLNTNTASTLARLPLRCVETEYPNKLDHVMNDPGEVRGPRALHPAFYGCFDWHSAVHGHWMLARLLRLFPELPEAPQIRQVLDRHFSAESLRAEVSYLQGSNRKSFERTYGWAWLLKLAEELREWKDPDAQRWSENLQ